MVQHGEAPSPARHRPGLDGLRGIAVVVVVAYHLELVPGGFVGVDVFFVLSGFLITGLVLDEVGGAATLSLRRFWGRRVRRLVPAVLVMVPTVLAAALALGWPTDRRRDLGIDAFATVTWWENWRQAGGGSYWDRGGEPFRHAWSLSVEEQFYVLWPLVVVAVVALVVRRGPRPGAVAGALGAAAAALAVASGAWMLVLSHRLADDALSRVYVGTDTRVVAPLAGCALACWARRPGAADAVRSRASLVAGLVGVAVLAWFVAVVEVDDPATYRQGRLIVAALAAVAVVRAAAVAERGDRDPLARLVTAAPAGYLGRRSYAIYLWAWPVQVLVAFRWPEVARPVLIVVTVAAALAIAELSHRVVEAPLRHRTGWAAASRRRRPAWATGAVASAAMIALVWHTSTPPPVHETVEAADAAADALRPVEPPATGTGAGDAGTDEPASAEGDLRVMLAGDSVAWTYGYYRPHGDELPAGIGAIDSRAIIGCGLLAAEGWGYPAGGDGPFATPAAEACAAQPEAERLGFEGRPDVLLLFPGAWEWSPARSPEGRVVPARSEEMRALLQERLLRKARAADEVGARTVIARWACPGAEAAPQLRDPAYLRWIDEVITGSAAAGRAEGLTIEVLDPSDEVCEGGDPFGAPTPKRAEATGDEIHVTSFEGGRWHWDRWLGPALVAGS